MHSFQTSWVEKILGQCSWVYEIVLTPTPNNFRLLCKCIGLNVQFPRHLCIILYMYCNKFLWKTIILWIHAATGNTHQLTWEQSTLWLPKITLQLIQDSFLHAWYCCDIFQELFSYSIFAKFVIAIIKFRCNDFLHHLAFQLLDHTHFII